MRQSQLSQRLENVRQEMNYSAAGVDDLIENSEDTTVESSRLASDDLAQYVLIKGNPDKEEETADDHDAAADEAEVGLEDGDKEDEDWKPDRKTVPHCQMKDQFIIRKIQRDHNAGRKFAAVCNVNLSSSGSSSEDEDDAKRRSTAVKCTDVKSSTSSQSHVDVGNSMTATFTKSAEEKRKLPPPEDVIDKKRRKSDDLSSDSSIGDYDLLQAVKSPLLLERDSDTEQPSPTTPVTAETPLPDTQLGTENGSTGIERPEPTTDKQDELDSEAKGRHEDVNAETGEVCFDEPVNGKLFATLCVFC